MVKDLARHRKADLCEALKVQILTTQLQPGEDLDEVSLCKDFGISRTPLREVLRELAGEGYVELRENRGARVCELSYNTLREFFLAAPMIYGAIHHLAAENRTKDQIEELKSAQRHFVSTLKQGTIAQRTLANNHFHEITGQMAANVYLLPSFKRLLIDHARIGMAFYQPTSNEMANRLSLAVSQHEEIIAAIQAGNAAKSAKLAQQHWNLSRGNIELYVTPAGLDAKLGSWGS